MPDPRDLVTPATIHSVRSRVHAMRRRFVVQVAVSVPAFSALFYLAVRQLAPQTAWTHPLLALTLYPLVAAAIAVPSLVGTLRRFRSFLQHLATLEARLAAGEVIHAAQARWQGQP